ncbi:MAG: hypothetical protein EBQ96_06045 [Proteobacteria bacterium]|nr:hypothetical protein [Pseudomonadota bacterium]
MSLHAKFDDRVYACTEHFGVFDLDETLFRHWDGLDDNIGAVVRDVLALELKERGITVRESEIEDITEESYAHHGLPMWLASQRWGIDHAILHRRYHVVTLDRHVLPELPERIEEKADFYRTLREQLQEAVSLDMKFGVLTHGCDTWGRVIPEALDIAKYMTLMRGIDNYGSRRKCTNPCLYRDFLGDAGFAGHIAGNTFMAEDRAKNLIVPARMGMVPYLVGDKRPDYAAEYGIIHYPDVNYVLAEQIRFRRQWLRVVEMQDKIRLFVPPRFAI